MEFFLVLPMIVLVLVGALQVIGVARARVELLGAVREGARIAATTPDPARAVEAVEAAMAPSARPHLRVSVSRPDEVGKLARVTAVLRYSLVEPLPPDWTVDLKATAAMAVER